MKHLKLPGNITNHHEPPWNITNHHKSSPIIMKHRKLSWNIMNHHEPPQNIMNHHEPPHVLTKTACFSQYLSEFLTELPQTTTNHDMDHYKWWHESSQITINHHKFTMTWHHHKSQITTNHHKPWHKPPWTMTESSTKHDMNHYKSPQTMTWTIMMTQKELCIEPYGFLVKEFAINLSTNPCERTSFSILPILWFLFVLSAIKYPNIASKCNSWRKMKRNKMGGTSPQWGLVPPHVDG